MDELSALILAGSSLRPRYHSRIYAQASPQNCGDGDDALTGVNLLENLELDGLGEGDDPHLLA